jgi:hypothetical protein
MNPNEAIMTEVTALAATVVHKAVDRLMAWISTKTLAAPTRGFCFLLVECDTTEKALLTGMIVAVFAVVFGPRTVSFDVTQGLAAPATVLRHLLFIVKARSFQKSSMTWFRTMTIVVGGRNRKCGGRRIGRVLTKCSPIQQ